MSKKEAPISEQQIFDTVVELFKTQKVKSVGINPKNGMEMCLYRSNIGLRCAVGALLSDEEYSVQMEGMLVHDLILENLLPDRLIPHKKFLVELQKIHDAEWFGLLTADTAYRLRQLADIKRLNSSKVDWA